MHFRVRKNVVQLIRTTYDVERKRGVNTIVGTVSVTNPELTRELSEALTEEEAIEFQSWVATRHRANELREELAALTLADAMGQAKRWFERENGSVAARAAATEVIFQWQGLRRLLAKQGLLD